MLKILNNDKFTTAQNRHSLVSLKIPILNTLPVRAILFALVRLSCAHAPPLCYLAQNRTKFSLDFEHPTRQNAHLSSAQNAAQREVTPFFHHEKPPEGGRTIAKLSFEARRKA